MDGSSVAEKESGETGLLFLTKVAQSEELALVKRLTNCVDS